MPRLKGDETLEIPAWIGGLEKNTPPALNEPGTLADGQNLVPTQASRMASRGGSRIVTTLKNDAGSPVEVTGLAGIFPWTSVGGLVVGYDTAQHKSYAWYLTQDMAFKGATEAQSRVDLSLEPTGTVVHASWKDTNGAPMPQATELFEGIYLCDAQLSIASRRYFLSLNQTVPVVQIGSPSPNAKVPRFAFAGSGDQGTATSGTATTLVDTTKVWTTSQFNGFSVTITAGTGAGETAIITGTTAPSTLTVASWSIATPDTTSQYVITPGVAKEILPYCLETYNNVLFIAGYGSEGPGDQDRPELLRHSFLGVAPSNSLALGDISDGFDKNAYNIIGAKGQRVTGMKQGRGYLLVAKANELYRISGAGRAYPGWQYSVEKIENTSGFGVANPNALCFAEGFWYGIGAAGMFRTDGFQAAAFNQPGQVTTLIGPRQADFRALDNLQNSFCFYHPDRRLILFGVHQQGTTPATYPTILWAWDVQRERWQPDWVLATPTAFFHGNNIPTTTALGPSAPPTNPVTSAITTTGFTASWTNGDATAQTEIWLLDPGNTWLLNNTFAPGITSVVVPGAVGHSTYQWKVRHTKNGLYSAYTVAQTVQTLLEGATPFDNGCTGSDQIIGMTNITHGTNVDMSLETSADGVTGWSEVVRYLNQPYGQEVDTFLAAVNPAYYRARTIDASWSVPNSVYSAVIGPIQPCVP
jgi:hypothetical protein